MRGGAFESEGRCPRQPKSCRPATVFVKRFNAFRQSQELVGLNRLFETEIYSDFISFGFYAQGVKSLLMLRSFSSTSPAVMCSNFLGA